MVVPPQFMQQRSQRIGQRQRYAAPHRRSEEKKQNAHAYHLRQKAFRRLVRRVCAFIMLRCRAVSAASAVDGRNRAAISGNIEIHLQWVYTQFTRNFPQFILVASWLQVSRALCFRFQQLPHLFTPALRHLVDGHTARINPAFINLCHGYASFLASASSAASSISASSCSN